MTLDSKFKEKYHPKKEIYIIDFLDFCLKENVKIMLVMNQVSDFLININIKYFIKH